MTLKFLVTGATGGIGGGVIEHFQKHMPKSDFAASSSNADTRAEFEGKSLNFRHADYNDRESLEKAFAGVENLLFVSSNTFDNELRTGQHRNVVDAAKKMGVGHVRWSQELVGLVVNNIARCGTLRSLSAVFGRIQRSPSSMPIWRQKRY